MTRTPLARKATACTAAAAVLLLATEPVPPAVAQPVKSYPAGCAGSSAQVISGPSSATLNLGGGSVVRITGTGSFTGGLGGFPAGALICVESGGRFAPSWAGTPNGTVAVAQGGTAVFSYASVGATFLLLNEGSTALNGSFNVNGAGYLDNAKGATLTGTGILNLGNGGVLESDGAVSLQNLTLNQGSRIRNGGSFAVAGTLDSNGAVVNTGTVTASGLLTNSGAPLTNQCVIKLSGNWTNSSTAVNSGMILLTSSRFSNSGSFRQDVGGVLAATDFSNDRTVTGFGSYRFTGNASQQGSFIGDDPASPIVVDSAAPGGRIFDLSNGNVANTVRGQVTADPDVVPAGCTDRTPTTADLVASKTGPATVDAGGTVGYTLTLSNLGPAEATGTVLTDRLPAGLGNVVLSDGGTLSGTTAGWPIGSLAAGATLTRTVTGTAPGSGTLTDTVSATTSTPQTATTDSDGTSAAATVTTTVQSTPANLAPVAADEQWTTVVNAPVAGALSASDPDTGQVLRWSLLTAPAHGSLSLRPDGTFSYQPDQDWTGRDGFAGRVCDNGSPSLCVDAHATVSVSPYVQDVSATTHQGEPVTIALTVNDVGQASAPTLLTAPAHGTAALEGDGSVRYTPADGYLGTDTFRYQACSPNAPDVCASAQVAVTVVPKPKAPPAADPLTLATLAGQSVTARIPATPADSTQILGYRVSTAPSRGTASVTAAGDVVYTPADATVTGQDAFQVTVCDTTDALLCTTVTVTVLISPDVVDDAGAATVGTEAVFDVGANDVGSAGPPEITTPPTRGTATVGADGSIRYTASSTGEDSLVYRRCTTDGTDLCGSATLTVSVGAGTLVQAGGTALDGTVNQPLTGRVDAASTSGRAVAYTVTTPAGHGTGTVDPASGAVRYTPATDYTGSDAFTVTACDGVTCATAQVTVTVRPLAAPGRIVTVAGQGAALAVAGLVTGADTAVTVTASPGHGSVQLTGGSFEYVPATGFAGTDVLGYRACSTRSPAVCADSQVLVWVAPVANGVAVTTPATVPVTVDATANDVGVAPGTTPFVVSGPQHGTVTVLPDGLLRYTPRGSWTGVDSLVYEIGAPVTSARSGYAERRVGRSGRLGAREAALTARAAVVVTVVPDLGNDRARTREGLPVTVDITANDIGDAGAPFLALPPSRGTVSFRGDRAVYTPLAGFTGTDSFTYRRCSPHTPDVCATALVSIDIRPRTKPTPPPTPPPTPTPSPGPPTPRPPHPHPATPGSLAGTGSSGGSTVLLFLAGAVVLAGAVLTLGTRSRGRH